MIHIGSFQLANRVLLAPMAGISDRPWRDLCRQFGVGHSVSEMLTSDHQLWTSEKSRSRLVDITEHAPLAIQIVGHDPAMMVDAAQRCVAKGARIIDINMGCPAKKVCSKAAGSALLGNEAQVKAILSAVCAGVDVPVTLKIRTGVDPAHKNGVSIARIAEDCGIQLLAVHGRTRACRFNGHAEYHTIGAIKRAVKIPVIANGDIDSPEKARQVLDETKADGVMIGRAAQGQPWLIRDIIHYLDFGCIPKAPSLYEIAQIMLSHLIKLIDCYGEYKGVRIARKHIGYYLKRNFSQPTLSKQFNQLQCAALQRQFIQQLIDTTHT